MEGARGAPFRISAQVWYPGKSGLLKLSGRRVESRKIPVTVSIFVSDMLSVVTRSVPKKD